MRFKTLTGREKYQNINKYLIKWDGKSLSKFQFEVKQFLFPYWRYEICYEELPVYGTKLRIDYYNSNRKIAIEVNGSQHTSYNKFFHNNNRLNYFKQIQRDCKKEKWCEINGIKLIQIYPEDLPLSKKFFKDLGIDL